MKAKDSQNRYVLIELKRSDAVARQVIHEVLKYIEGIKENKSLKNDELVAYSLYASAAAIIWD